MAAEHPIPIDRRPPAARRTAPLPAATGRLSRPATIAGRAGAIAGRGLAARTYARVRRDEALAQHWEARTAQEVADSLGDLRGAVMKVGQMLSYLDHRIPPALRSSLAGLQEDAPRMAPSLVAEVVEEELGARPERVFARWDATPIAAASIGQVHRAMTHDGDAVAVKVQYPGIDRAVASDLSSLRLLLLPLRALVGHLDVAGIAEEVRARVTEELDYRLEAANQRRFAEIYAGHPHLHVPAVHDELSTARVLVTELVSGHRLEEAATWSARARDLAGESVYRFAVGSLHGHGLVHGDLHPGNLRFHGDGRISFLDFGLVRAFDPVDQALISASVQAWIAGDAEALLAVLTSAGYLSSPHPELEADVHRFFGSFYPLLAHDGPVTVRPEHTSELIDTYLDERYEVLRKHGGIPAPLLFLHRLNLGLHAVLGRLGATANWRRVSAESWSGDHEPAPGPLGLAHRRWQEGRAADGPARGRAMTTQQQELHLAGVAVGDVG